MLVWVKLLSCSEADFPAGPDNSALPREGLASDLSASMKHQPRLWLLQAWYQREPSLLGLRAASWLSLPLVCSEIADMHHTTGT